MVWPERLYVTHSVVDNIVTSWLKNANLQNSVTSLKHDHAALVIMEIKLHNLKIEYIYIPNSSPAIKRKISDENQLYLKFWQIFQCFNKEKEVSFFPAAI